MWDMRECGIMRPIILSACHHFGRAQRPQEDVCVDTPRSLGPTHHGQNPHVKILPLYGDHPQSPEHQHWILGVLDRSFKNSRDKMLMWWWHRSVWRTIGGRIGAVWIHPDMERNSHPISGTRVRNNPWSEMEFFTASCQTVHGQTGWWSWG
jgi:hypothetical protein